MAAVSDGGDLYTWGEGRHGALGHGNFDPLEQPKLVENVNNKFVAQVWPRMLAAAYRAEG